MAMLEGYKKFPKKDNSGICFVATYSYEMDGQNQWGRAFKDIFVSEQVFNMLTPSMIGKECSIDYEFDRGYPRIVGISVNAVSHDKKG